MGKQRSQSYTPGQTAISVNHTELVNRITEKTRNGLHPICIQSKKHPKEINMEKKEASIEVFWKEAMKADSLLLWIVVDSRFA